LLGKHSSKLHNKNIADIFYTAGFIEAWGQGVSKVKTGFIPEGL
jgi:ATP-dependent DNA helicase RecG